MYLLIFPEFPVCAFSSINVQIHKAAFLCFLCFTTRYQHYFSPLVLSICHNTTQTTRFLQIHSISPGHCQIYTKFRSPYRRNIVKYATNSNVQNLCEMGHNRLFVQSAQILNQNMPIRCAIFTKIRLSAIQWRLLKRALPQNNVFSFISAFADLTPALIYNKSLLHLPAPVGSYYTPLWISSFLATFFLFHIASSPSGYIYSHFCDVSTYFSNFLRCT